MNLTLVVMAAGVGSRYGDLKQVDGVGPNGETIMDYAIFDAHRAGFDKVVFVIRRELETIFRTRVVPRYAKHLAVALVYQELNGFTGRFPIPADRKKPWGTGQSVLSAKDEVETPFAVINADDFYGRGSFRLLADHLSSAAARNDETYAMVGFRLERTLSEHGSVARGICRVSGAGELESIVERLRVERGTDGIWFLDEAGRKQPLTGDETVSMNFWGLNPGVFAHLKILFGEFLKSQGTDPKAEFYVPNAIGSLIRSGKGRVKVLSSDECWFGITYRKDREAAVTKIAELTARGIYPTPLW
ncbi:MAG: nucleotidyltransferase [Pseudomonadota bacterium]